MPSSLSVVMLGATGEVGGHVVSNLLSIRNLERLTLLGRRPLKGLSSPLVHQHTVDVHDHTTYEPLLNGHRTAICTLGVGQPSKVSREEFVRVDKLAVLAFATACKAAGVAHFELLGSVGSDAQSRSFYLRTKGRGAAGLAADAVRLSRPVAELPGRSLGGLGPRDGPQHGHRRVWTRRLVLG
jgi:uncharacterized protein YbjT (DUF2867 family)